MEIKQGFYREQIMGLDKMSYYSWSKCRLMLQSPLAFFDHYSSGKQTEPTKAMDWGRTIHTAILEGQKFREKYVVEPKFTGLTLDGKESPNSKEAKDKKKAWLSDLPVDAIVVTEEELESVIKVVDNVLAHEGAMKLLTGGIAEGWGYVFDEKYKRWQLIRADNITNDLISVEVKTTSKRIYTARQWIREAFSMGYVGQLGHTSRGVGLMNGIENHYRGAWIVIHSFAPFEVFVFTADETSLADGARAACKSYALINKHLELDGELKNKKMWPGRQNGMAEECIAEPWMVQEEETNE